MALSQAASDYREFLAREDTPQERLQGLRAIVRILIHLGERDEARERYSELASMKPHYTPDTTDQINQARLLRLEGELASAMGLVSEILKLDVTNVAALLLRGTLAMDVRDYGAAESDLQKVVALSPMSQQGRYKLAITLTRLGRNEEAAVHFNESRRIQNLMDRILELRQKAELRPEEESELVDAFEKAGLQKLADQYRGRQRP